MALRLAVLLVGIGVLGTGGIAQAKAPSVPVKITIAVKPEPQFACEECLHFSGRITSPKAACGAKRVLANAVRYRAGSEYAGTTYRDKHFVETDGRGRWDIVVAPGPNPLAWMQVSVPQAGVGGAVCKAARARVRL